MLTQTELKSIFSYSEDTGIFTKKISHDSRGRVSGGFDCGSLHKSTGYLRIQINKKQYLCHRLAWLYIHGCEPLDMIDHINGIKTDNRIVNLREATNQENQFNRDKCITSSTGSRGVFKNRYKFRVRVTLNKIRYNLGSYNTIEEATNIYREFVKNNHGEFLFNKKLCI